MELRHLRYFVAVGDRENVSRAALKLHVSQPALSRQIRDLEAELGFTLLDRGAKSVRLTAAGRVFLTEARAVLERAEAAVQAARTVARGRPVELHVGYAPSPTARLLPATLRAFQAAAPAVAVRLHDLSTEEMLAGLRAGRLAVALVVRPSPAMLPGLAFEALARETLCLAVAPKHPLARKRVVPLAKAVREPLVAFRREEYPEYHELLAAVFAATGRPARIGEEHDSVTSLIAAVEAGNGVAVMPRALACTAGPRLRLLGLTPVPAPLVVGLAWPRATLPETAQTFVRCAKEVATRHAEAARGR